MNEATVALPDADIEDLFNDCPGCGNPIDFNYCDNCDYFQ